ncbi:hypothetical protein P8C59_007160 [Phyllachora maydis]|uniref:Uncharacterized protein n=1 Tax=Phyllachora maydis TaxID=1825666 RepID=A0AAD9I7S1_9PEZI|nr:hypothetical protein P8C59_007160 [Phyllachora maydis]
MAANFATKRLGKELQKVNQSLPPGIQLISAENFEEWMLDIQVLDINPLYKDQKYRLKFKFSSSYPIEPPEVVFVQLPDRPIPIHPHIYSNGIICLDLLGQQGWSPVQNVESAYVRGKKNLILEKTLAGPLGVIVKFKTLTDYGVDKVFFLENDNADTSQRNVVFIARGECGRHARAIADQIKRLQRESQTGHDFHVFWVPRRTRVSDQLLEEAGVLGDATILDLPLYFFPLERDVLSLELDNSFQELYLAKDPTPLFLLARALMGIQLENGLFPRIIGKGDHAKRVADLLLRMRQEVLAGEDGNETDKFGLTPSTTIETAIIIDREVDFVTPLLTQLTYEGLIDEVFGIQNSQTEVDSTVIGTAQAVGQGSTATPVNDGASRKRKVPLDSSDTLYSQLRDTNFAIVGSVLNQVARRLQSDYNSGHATKTTAELKDFFQRLPGYQAEKQSLKVHTNLAEEIMKYTRTEQFTKLLEVQQNLAAGADPSSQFEAIEELISRNIPLSQVLRLLCTYSCISGGIKSKEFDLFRRLIVQGYGYQHLLTLHNLEKLQMFLSRSSPLASMIPMTASSAGMTGTKTNYAYLRKPLRLIVDEVNEHDPNDIAYVYSGYAPLSIRLVQSIIQKQYLTSITRGNAAANPASVTGASPQGWRGFDDAVKHVRGQTFDEAQRGEDKAVKARALLSGSAGKKTVFVIFVGGISFTEIAALRFIAKKEEARRNIVICTTSIVSGNKMMEAAVEKESHKPYNGVELARDSVKPVSKAAFTCDEHHLGAGTEASVAACAGRTGGVGFERSLSPTETRKEPQTQQSEVHTEAHLEAAPVDDPPVPSLDAGVSEEDDIDLEPATREPGATLGSVTDYAISQYRNIVDLNALDYRLLNWHVANLEYSNAINYHQLSLQGWDIDAGNEWEGKHTMVKDYTRNRGRFFQWFNLTEPSGLPVLLALMAGDAGLDTEQTCNDDLVAEATDVLRSVFGQDVPNPVESIITRWSSDKFARGSYSSAGPDMKATDYEAMAAPVGNLYFAGEHTTGTHPATVHGAYLSGLRAASEVAEAILGPIEIPTPLILPKGSSASNKRKAPIDPVAAAQEAYEIATWDHIVEQIGLRPQKPAKPCINAYTFYSKVNYEAARQRCETRRRPGKGSRASANEVRGMTSKMWKETSPAERAPFEAMAEASKTAHTAEMEVFNRAAATWDKEATELRLKYEREHPNPAVEMALSAAERTARRTRMKVDSYADADASDLEMAG